MSGDDTTVARASVAWHTPSTGFVLHVARGAGAGTRFDVNPSDPSRLLLGKGPACSLRLADPSVSRRHASVEVEGEHLRLIDLKSTNGTTVNGVRVREALLVGGEVICLGATELRVERVSARSPAQTAPSNGGFGELIGRSPAMQRLFPLCERLAFSEVPVIIEGETGVGKEQLARVLHAMGPRKRAPFVVLDCTAVAPSLVEAELFGARRGAYTGASGDRIGVFEAAHGGTLLIDEIGDLALPMQAKLLRAVDRLEVTPVGSITPVRVDVRVMAATRRDLDREVMAGRFRDDLFHRLAISRIELPPLRERRGDVALLATHFWQAMGGASQPIPEALMRAWEDHTWPGNVRELRNAVLRRLALGDLGLGEASDTPSSPDHTSSDTSRMLPATDGDIMAAILALDLPYADARARAMHEFECRFIERALEQNDGNIERAAAAAGIGKRHFHRIKARTRSC